jgi:hypothetical protein
VSEPDTLAERFNRTEDRMTHLAGSAALVVVLLLAAPLQASAECAWVLWTSFTSRGATGSDEVRWWREGAFDTRRACLQAGERQFFGRWANLTSWIYYVVDPPRQFRQTEIG